ncbi:PEP-CTERM sorting domain-containing protein [Aquisphaera insulae]|uniref:PEP-CTERM sorting domain-containing protein n=1 Tax=Aquisphaera insulae TaxID=2712864 RepID=UPI0013EA09CC|nr:PEP-CTERM sorting domain-containing protein [Aquisphaera insulae]
MSRPSAVFILAVFLLPDCRSLASPYYQITRIGFDFAQLNNAGQVSGTVDYYAGFYERDSNGTYTASWMRSPAVYDPSQGGKVTLLGVTSPSGTDPGHYDWRGTASGLSDSGQVVGIRGANGESYSYDSKSGTLSDIPVNYAHISPLGQIVGTNPVKLPDGTTSSHPVSYQNGTLTDLGLPPGMVSVNTQAVNSSGQVLVQGYDGTRAETLSFLYNKGTWTNLGSMSASLLNSRGDVAGVRYSGDYSSQVAVYMPHGGSATIIGTLPGYSVSEPLGMNDRGEIVGNSIGSATTNVGVQGFLYSNGLLTNLNDLIDPASGWTIHQGLQINDKGQILALADQLHGGATMLLLTPSGLDAPPDAVMPELPVPEPSTLLVFGGLCAGCLWRFRNRQSNS